MNKRQKKKNQKKRKMFLSSWVNSYKELKNTNRMLHEYTVSMNRKRAYDHIWDMYFDEFEDVNVSPDKLKDLVYINEEIE